jgi:hypothetical protein
LESEPCSFFLVKNALLIPGPYAPSTWKTNFKISKRIELHVYLYILYAHAQFHEKGHILWVVQKIQKMRRETGYFSTGFCYFYIDQKSFFFS